MIRSYLKHVRMGGLIQRLDMKAELLFRVERAKERKRDANNGMIGEVRLNWRASPILDDGGVHPLSPPFVVSKAQKLTLPTPPKKHCGPTGATRGSNFPSVFCHEGTVSPNWSSRLLQTHRACGSKLGVDRLTAPIRTLIKHSS